MTFSASAIFRAVDMISAPARNMEKSVGKLNNSFRDLKSAAIGLTAGLAVGTLFSLATTAITEFDSSMSSLKAITGVTGEAFKPFKQEIYDIGNATNKSFVDVAKAMELIGSAKPELLDNAKAMGQTTKAAILLSKAAGMDLETSAGSLTKALNQFGKGADQAAKFVDILSTSEQKGTATTPQIIEALINGGSAAKTMGLSFEETNAIIQAYAKAGVLGSEAGTQMAAVLSKLAQSTDKRFNPAVVGATKAIDNLSKSNFSYKQLIQKFGPESAKFIATLVNQNDVVQKLSGNLYDQGNAQKQADERAKAFNNRIAALTNRFKNLMISGNETSGTLNAFGYIIGFITNNLGLIIGAVGLFLGYMATYKAVMLVSTAVTWLHNLALDYQMLATGRVGAALLASKFAYVTYTAWTAICSAATWLLTTATTAFSIALQSTGVPLMIIAIAALIAGIILLVKNWDTCSTAMLNFGKTILKYVIEPIIWVLDAIGKLTGAKWAINLSTNLKGFQEGLSKDKTKQKNTEQTEQPVNKDAAIMTQKKILETNNRQDVQINIDDATGRARMSGGASPIPVLIRNTKGGF